MTKVIPDHLQKVDPLPIPGVTVVLPLQVSRPPMRK